MLGRRRRLVQPGIANRPRAASATQRDLLVTRLPGFTFLALLSVLTVWGLWQNFARLGSAYVQSDEYVYMRAGWDYVHGQAPASRAFSALGVTTLDNYEHPPLAKLLFGLAQLGVGSRSILADRAVAALCTVATALLLGMWVARCRGRWAGLLVAALALLPGEVIRESVRFGRYGMLDPVARLFMAASVVAGWAWFRRRGRSAWFFAAVTGAAVGLATAAKENAGLGMVGPAVLLLALAPRDGGLSLLAVRLLQSLAAAAVSAAMFLATYLPIGDAPGHIRFLVDYQLAHGRLGHVISFAGRISAHPPWWTFFWFAISGMGILLTLFLVGSAALAVALSFDRLVAWCLASLAVPLLFHCFVAHVVLAFYWTLWTPMVLVLAGLGVHAVAARTRHAGESTAGSVIASAVLPGLLLVPFASSVSESASLLHLRPEGMQVLPQVLQARGLPPPFVVGGFVPAEIGAYVPDLPLVYDGESPRAVQAGAVVLARPRCLIPIDRSVAALVDVNVRNGRLRRVYEDSRLEVYAVRRPLQVPSATQAAYRGYREPRDYC